MTRTKVSLTAGFAALVLSATIAGARTIPAKEAFTALCEGKDAIPIDVAGSRHFVEVTLSGPKKTETVRFGIDTGGNTPGVMLAKSIAMRLGFKSERDLPRRIRIGGHEIALPEGASWFLLDDQTPEGKKEAQFEWATRKSFDGQGQLGAGFLSRFLVCLDPARGRLALVPRSTLSVDPVGAPWVPLALQPGGPNRALYPFIVANLGKMPVGLLLDTGATTSMLEVGYLKELKKVEPSWPSAIGAAGDADMHGGAGAVPMLKVPRANLTFPVGLLPAMGLSAEPSIEIGPVLVEAQPDGTFEEMWGRPWGVDGAHGVLANDVLNRFRLLIDYEKGRLYLEPTGRPQDASASMTRIGVSLAFDPKGCPVIKRITDTNAPETRAELRIGDVLLAVDEKDTCKAWHHEISTLLAGAPGQSKKLRVRRGEAVLERTLPVVDLLAPHISAAPASATGPKTVQP